MLYSILIILIVWIPYLYAKKAIPEAGRQMQDEWRASEEKRKKYTAALRQLDLNNLTMGQRKKIYRELRQKYDVEIVCHTTKPLMADTARLSLSIIKGMLITIPACSIILFLILEAEYYGLIPALKMFIGLIKETVQIYDIPMGLMLDFYFLLIFACDFLQQYMRFTKCTYHDTRITIRRYLRPNKHVDYKDISECIRAKKILIRNGRFELPYAGGQIPVYCTSKTPAPEFYQFINQKCGIKMPSINLNKHISRTGIGYILINIGIILILLLAYIMLLSAFWEYKLDFSRILTYISAHYYDFILPGLIFIGLGLILKIVFYFPAKKYFKQYANIIKVPWW